MSALVPNILIGVSSAFLLLLFMFGFGGTDTVVDVGIDFGMQFLPADNQIRVWAGLPHPAYIDVKLYGFTKIDLATNATEKVELMEFFPVSEEPNVGYAGAQFGIELTSSSVMPVLNRTQELIPMVWRRETQGSSRVLTSIFVVASFVLNNWMLVKWTMVTAALGGLLAAVALQFQKKKEESDVE